MKRPEEIISNRNTKNREYIGETKQDKKANNDRENTTQTPKD